jgi:DNA-binding response OmpR family regulator
MSDTGRFENARRLAEVIDTDDGGGPGVRVWLREGNQFLPIDSPSAAKAAHSNEATEQELQARGALGFGEGLQPTCGYVEIPSWPSLDAARQQAIGARIQRAAHAQASAMAIAAATAGESPRKIVITEPDPALCKNIHAVLTSAGYEVFDATNGREAIDVTRAELPDLVLMGWILPVINGKDATIELKRDPLTRHIPILMLTSRTSIEDRVEALDAGVQDFMTKPFDWRELLARIEQQLRWRKLLDNEGQPSAQVAVEPKAPEQTEAAQLASWEDALQHQDYERALNGAMQFAEHCGETGAFEEAAQGYELASRAADGSRRPDLANKLQRLAGGMYLRLAEESSDTAKIQLGYTMSARMFLTAGNLVLAKQAAGYASDSSRRG